MSVTFKKVLRKDPFHKDGTGKYYPQLIVWGKSATLESIAVQMKESSSLTLGDIQSVISIRPQVAATRAEDRMDFVDLESQLKAAGSGSGGGEGGGNEGGDGGLDENPLG